MNPTLAALTDRIGDTLATLRGLTAAARAFRENPNDPRRDDRLTHWLAEAEVVDRGWQELAHGPAAPAPAAAVIEGGPHHG
jgi:hypothetical protein